MPNIKSQIKRVRTSSERAAAVKSEKTKVKTKVKAVRRAVEAGDAEKAGKALQEAYSVLDASVGKGVHTRNYAMRAKSRLAKAVNGMSAEEEKK